MGNANLPATQKANTIRSLFEQRAVKQQLSLAVPRHLTVDRLLRVAMTSIQRTPKLLDCTQKSLLSCVMTCAQLGLEPDAFLGQAYLVPFKNKGVLEAQLIPGYRGYIALARRSGEVQSVSAQVVYENDEFVLQYGLEDILKHVPAEGDRGQAKGAYVVFRYKDGSYSFDYMSTEDIEKIRSRSMAKDNGPWVTDWAEMAKKTVIKRHAKLAPLSVEFQQASALEDMAHAGESQMPFMGEGFSVDEGETVDVTPDFDSTIPKDTDPALLNQFLGLCAKQFDRSVDEIKAEAAREPDNFWTQCRKWAEGKGDLVPITGKQFAALTGKPLSEFQNLRDKGVGEFYELHKAEIPTWPENIQRIVREKFAKKPEWAKLLEVEEKEPEKAESEHTGPGYVFCPEGGPYAGNRISCIITCSNCDQRDNCNEYQLYLESQKDGSSEQF